MDCKTNGTSLNIFIEDKYQIYDVKRDFQVTWWISGRDNKESDFSKDLNFSINGLGMGEIYNVDGIKGCGCQLGLCLVTTSCRALLSCFFCVFILCILLLVSLHHVIFE